MKRAGRSAAAIFRLFEQYRAAGDFVGMDMARKFLQMGYTRARRYANRGSGRKYAAGKRLLPLKADPEKARAAEFFYARWRAARLDPVYRARLAEHKARYR